MVSTDLIDQNGYIVAQDFATGTISAAFAPTGQCVLYSDAVIRPSSPQGYPVYFGRVLLTPFLDVYEVADTGWRPLDLNDFYPYCDGATVAAVGINELTGEFYYGVAPMYIYINYEFYY